MDSRTSSILINLNLNLNSQTVENSYSSAKEGIEELQKRSCCKTYTSLKATMKECYLTGSLKYGNNFVM